MELLLFCKSILALILNMKKSFSHLLRSESFLIKYILRHMRFLCRSFNERQY